MIIITLSIYIIYCFDYHDIMLRCIECGTIIDISNFVKGGTADCPCCGIDLEIIENSVVAHQLGLSEE